MVKVFIICPVRDADQAKQDYITQKVAQLERDGHTVYYPARDTNQVDETGYRICFDNKQAISDADLIYVIWDGQSRGSLFDLGVAFALDKQLIVDREFLPAASEGKSFQNMMVDWSHRSGWG